MSLFQESRKIVRNYHEHGFPVQSAGINDTVILATAKDYGNLSLNGAYHDCPMNDIKNHYQHTFISQSGGTKLSTTGMGPCMCLIYAVEVVNRENPSEHVSWVYGLHHLPIGMIDYDESHKKMVGPFADIYKDMITRVHEKAEDPSGLNGLISQSNGFLIPGYDSDQTWRGKNVPDEIVKQLLTEGPIDNNWSSHFAKYSPFSPVMKKNGGGEGVAVAVDIGKNQNLVITTYVASWKVKQAANKKYPKKQATQQSIDIKNDESFIDDPKNLKDRISEIKRKERELYAERRRLEKRLAKRGSVTVIWV